MDTWLPGGMPVPGAWSWWTPPMPSSTQTTWHRPCSLGAVGTTRKVPGRGHARLPAVREDPEEAQLPLQAPGCRDVSVW